MSIQSTSSIVTNGLIFSYDMNNRQSYKGPPLQNKLAALSATTASGSGYLLTSNTEVVKIPTLGETQVVNCFLQNNGSNWCCVNVMNFGNTGSIISGGTTHTYLLLYRVDSGYTHPNFMYRYEYGPSGYLGETGVFDTSKRVHLGGGWYYAWNTFTPNASTTNMTCYSFTYNYSNYSDKYSWAKVAIVQGDYSGMHPKYWPDLGTTRSNTQALVDLTNNNTITVNNLTYNSDGTFSFNGSNSDVRTPLFTNSRINVTMSGWFYVNLGTVGTFLNNGDDPGGYCIGIGQYLSNADNQVCALFGYVRWILTGVYYQYTGWHMVTMTLDGSGVPSIYINGNLIGTYSGSMANVPSAGTGFSVGSQWGIRYANTKSGNVSFYNRQLTDYQIKQNFDAQRRRYGL